MYIIRGLRMLFAHIADTHLGYRQYNLDEREEDFYNAFHEAVDKIIEKQCKFVLHSGDLFNDSRPHVRAMIEAMNGLERLTDEGIEFIAIAGNHDLMRRRGAIPPHKLYKNLEFLTAKNPFRIIDDTYICGLPYYSKIHIYAFKEKINELVEKGKNFEKRILMLHQGLDTYLPHFASELKLNDIPKGFDYYALGHVHKRIIASHGNGKLAYPGSTEIWSVDEIDDWKKKGKGFFIIDTDSFEVEKVNISCVRQFFKMEIDSTSNIEKLKSDLDITKKPILNITLSANSYDYSRLYNKVRNELGTALYLNIRKNRIEKKDEIPLEENVNMEKLIIAALPKDGYSKDEREYAYCVYKYLKNGEKDGAKKITDDFFKNWAPKSRSEKTQKNQEVSK
jgi:DNA repair exonuclease SbcCD nuclease subunit|tara:strand:+ start:8878 stop:10056 length:1179 start_codon:yes stop_codon:yes gene_type:complete